MAHTFSAVSAPEAALIRDQTWKLEAKPDPVLLIRYQSVGVLRLDGWAPDHRAKWRALSTPGCQNIWSIKEGARLLTDIRSGSRCGATSFSFISITVRDRSCAGLGAGRVPGSGGSQQSDSSPPAHLAPELVNLCILLDDFLGEFLPRVAVNWPLLIKAKGQVLCLRPLYVLFSGCRLITSGSRLRLLRKRRPGSELWVMPSTEQRTQSLMRYTFAYKHHPAAVYWQHSRLTGSKEKCFFLVKHLITV